MTQKTIFGVKREMIGGLKESVDNRSRVLKSETPMNSEGMTGKPFSTMCSISVR